MSQYLNLPDANDYVSTPDHASLDITGDLDLRVKISLDDWTPTSQSYVLAKWGGAGNRAYSFSVLTSGQLSLQWSEDGTASTTQSSTSFAGPSDGATKWIRATLDVTNGSNRVVTFYDSDDGVTWSQVQQFSSGAITSIFSGGGSLLCGRLQTNFGTFVGKHYQGQVYDGIDGTLVADFNADDFIVGDSNSDTATDSTGKIWTITGSANTFIGPGFPAAPTNLIATAVSTTQINLSWDAVGDATGYDVWRDTVRIVTNQAGTTYNDTGRSPGTEYDYQVGAVKEG